MARRRRKDDYRQDVGIIKAFFESIDEIFIDTEGPLATMRMKERGDVYLGSQ